MNILKFDLEKTYGAFKPMNCVNNGPAYVRHKNDQYRTNIETYTEAKIPYARNHDASFCQTYGSEHTVDISAIFTDFDADPYDPASYDFACTDEYIKVTALAGTKTFYRLGQKIEHYIKKFSTLPPKDFHKWAVICEHIIRHYTEGWADGFDAGIEYWEIWNEADGANDDTEYVYKTCWGGTKAQFFDLYEITAKHLKSCFPNLKIGGPALCWNEEWANDFLREMKERNVELDFFSWHIYCTEPAEMLGKAERIKKMLVENGYENTESILNEWNYVKDWGEGFVDTIRQIIGMKGAAFIMACMSAAQKSSIDMLMYYDARPCIFNGMFDFYTLLPLKGYYPFKWFSEFYGLEELRCESAPEYIYTLCGKDSDGKVKAVVTYYTDNDGMPEKTVTLDFGRNGEFEAYALNEEQTNEPTALENGLTFTLKPNACIFIKEK